MTIPGISPKYYPGQCVVQCQAGDQRCLDTGTYEVCNNGLWSAGMNCTTGTCQQFFTSTGAPRTVCGVCIPGLHRCTTATGAERTTSVCSVGGGSCSGGAPTCTSACGAASGACQGVCTLPPDIETCDMTGAWGAASACTVGGCLAINRNDTDTSNDDALCIAQCAPGAEVCMGGASALSQPIPGTAQHGTCTTGGMLPASGTACAGATSCRKDLNGNALGCVQCVGATKNENGLTDTRCTSAAGGVGTTNVESCKTDNTWPTTPAAGSGCPSGTSCLAASPEGNRVIYCHDCFLGECTESNLNQLGGSCMGQGLGGPMSCNSGANPGTTVSDCCSAACFSDVVPATCH
jgi:hypothetical protein